MDRLDFKDKRWNNSTLKRYLKNNGVSNFKNLKTGEDLTKKELIKLATYIEEENQKCSSCNKLTDDCECDRCDKCYEIITECSCPKKVNIRQKTKKKLIKRVKKKISINLESDSESKKEDIETEDESSSYDSSSDEEVEIKNKYIKKKKEYIETLDDIETDLQITSMKIKIKVFLSEKVEKKPALEKDVFKLIELILKKYSIKFKNDDTKFFTLMFKRIFKQNKLKQKMILQDIIKYLIEAKFESFM